MISQTESLKKSAERKARLDSVDTARRTVLSAVTSELNGHMSRNTMSNLRLGKPIRCSSCGNVFLERRAEKDSSYGTCDSCGAKGSF